MPSSSPFSRNGAAPSGVPAQPAALAAAAARKRNDYWLTAAEVADLLDCSERSVWKWEAEGVIPPAVRRGKKWTRWRRHQVEAYRDGTWQPEK